MKPVAAGTLSRSVARAGSMKGRKGAAVAAGKADGMRDGDAGTLRGACGEGSRLCNTSHDLPRQRNGADQPNPAAGDVGAVRGGRCSIAGRRAAASRAAVECGVLSFSCGRQ